MLEVSEIMTPGVFTIPKEITVKEAAIKMTELKVGYLVVGSASKVEGVISERDIITRVLGVSKSPYKTLVKDIMTVDTIAVYQHEQPQIALEMMEANRIRHVLVFNNQHVCVGMLSIRNLLKTFIEAGNLN